MDRENMESRDSAPRCEEYQAPEIKELGKFVSPTVTAGGSCDCRCKCIFCDCGG